jgi:hypothetical protein
MLVSSPVACKYEGETVKLPAAGDWDFPWTLWPLSVVPRVAGWLQWIGSSS